MTNEQIILITQIMIWVGVAAASPFIYRVTYQVIRYCLLLFQTHSEVVIINESGGELHLRLKAKGSRQEVIDAIRKSLNGNK